MTLKTIPSDKPVKVRLLCRKAGTGGPVLNRCVIRNRQLICFVIMPVQPGLCISCTECYIKAAGFFFFAIYIKDLVQSTVTVFHYNFVVLVVNKAVFPSRKITMHIFL